MGVTFIQNKVSKLHLRPNGRVAQHSWITHRFLFLEVCPIRFKLLTYYVYAPLLNQIGALEAYPNLLRLDMSSRVAGPLNLI